MPTSKRSRLKSRLTYPELHAQYEHAVSLLDRVYTRLKLGDRSSRRVGDGERRARERLAAHRAEFAYTKDIPDRATRQRARREVILRQRQAITRAKAAMARKIEGGSAVIRTLDDIERIMG